MVDNNISFRKVSFVFDGRIVVNSFDQEINGGEHVAFVGESGAGKSTKLNSIVGLTVPTSGTVSVAGLQVNPANIHAIRAKTAWIPQELNLPFDSVEELLKHPYELKVNKHLKFERDKATLLMEKVGLDESVYTKRLDLVSGGEKQRLVLVSALLLNKRILLLDEPTSALDHASRDKLIGFLKSLVGTTIVAITHDSGFSVKMDRVVNLVKL